ncbi:MAG: methyltransferase [Candidatus Brockarchaeota archaeon]|nr:methyltransferase [Candidatus Brockarchaeota archaeon]
MRIRVDDYVYPPSEDSYMLLDIVKNIKAEKALEIGCGCGLISLFLSRNCTEVFAVDVSKHACLNTLENLKGNDLKGIVYIVNGDMTTAFRKGLKFSLIVSNPPYLPVEQSADEDISWAAGRNGFFSKRLLENALPLLSEDGVMFLVQSSLSDLKGLKQFIEERGYKMEEVSQRGFFFEKIMVFKISIN